MISGKHDMLIMVYSSGAHVKRFSIIPDDCRDAIYRVRVRQVIQVSGRDKSRPYTYIPFFILMGIERVKNIKIPSW